MQQLNGLDASLWFLETETQMLHICALVKMADYPAGPMSLEEARELLMSRIDQLEAFHLRIVPSPIPLALPYWVEEESFDFDRHVFLHRLSEYDPSAGDESESDVGVSPDYPTKWLVSRLLSGPIDRSLSPWEVHLIEVPNGLQMLFKVHHAMYDGLSGLQALVSLFETLPGKLSERKTSRGNLGGRSSKGNANQASSPSFLRALLDVPGEAVGRLESAVEFQNTLSELVKDFPNGIEVALGKSVNFGAPRLGISGSLTAARSIDSFSYSMGKVRNIARRFRSSVNDVLVGTVSLAFRRYLYDVYGENLESAPIALMPISLSRGQIHGARNQVAGQLIALSTSSDDPVQAINDVRSEILRAKTLHRRFGPQMVETFTRSFATPLLSTLARMVSQAKVFDRVDPVFNLVISNVSGAVPELFFGGNEIESITPFGPLVEGVSFNLTVTTYLGEIFFGLQTCPDRVAQPEVFFVALSQVFDKLDGSSSPSLER